MEGDTRSPKHEHARSSLPGELKCVSDDLVDDYRFSAQKHHGSPFVSYGVLAELVRIGWRLVDKDGGPLQRTKYMQSGTGQVFYLRNDAESGKWVVEMFTGGPEASQAVGAYDTREAAEKSLAEMDCEKMQES